MSNKKININGQIDMSGHTPKQTHCVRNRTKYEGVIGVAFTVEIHMEARTFDDEHMMKTH